MLHHLLQTHQELILILYNTVVIIIHNFNSNLTILEKTVEPENNFKMDSMNLKRKYKQSLKEGTKET